MTNKVVFVNLLFFFMAVSSYGESLSVISGKDAAQIVEIKTKSGLQGDSIAKETQAKKWHRALFEKLGMGSKLDIDLKSIEEFVEKNPTAYKDLMDRFLKDPASLSKEEVANLYYGFAYTKDYDPIHVDMMVEPHKLFREGKMRKAYKVCIKELQKTPVSLSFLWIAMQISYELNNKEEAARYLQMFKVLYDVVTASGNGFSKENAIKVIFIGDEYAIFRDIMKLKLTQQDFVEHRYDRMTLETGNKGESIILWFDTNLIQQWRKKNVTPKAN